VLGTIAAVRRELSDGGLVRRYSTDATDDGVKGGEGLFIACSFWLVDALHASRQQQDAIDHPSRLVAGPDGQRFLAEEQAALVLRRGRGVLP
jgi:GH15 family glucan-1,4-alpha-glucosidase